MPASKRRGALILALSLATNALLLIPPARAEGGTALGSVNVHELLVGGTQAFHTFTVNNVHPIDHVKYVHIYADIDEAMTPVFAGAPEFTPRLTYSETGDPTPDGVEFLLKPNEDGIRPGETFGFGIMANSADESDRDIEFEWLIETSTLADPGEKPIAFATAAAEGALDGAVRVLRVDSVQLVDPVGVRDNTATTGQAGVKVQSVITNLASAPANVAGVLTPGAPPINGTTEQVTSTPAPQAIPAYDRSDPDAVPSSATFDFTITMGQTGSRQLTADGTGDGLNAVGLQSAPVTIQSVPTVSYTINTLFPREAQSESTQAFRFTGSKGSTTPAMFIDAEQSFLSFHKVLGDTTDGSTEQDPPVFTAPMASDVTYPAAGGSRQFDFVPTLIPGDHETRDKAGISGARANLVGIDGNDAPFSLRTFITANNNTAHTAHNQTNFTIDNASPVVDARLAAPANQTEKSNFPVAEPGQTLTLSGSVKRNVQDTASDPLAKVIGCDLVTAAYTATGPGEILATRNLPLVAAGGCMVNTSGNLTGTIPAPTLPDGIDRALVYVTMTVADYANNTTFTSTTTTPTTTAIAIDDKKPVIAGVLTGCGPDAAPSCNDLRTVRVALSEPVKGDFAPIDFTVANNTVVGATSTCTSRTFCDAVTLTLAAPFAVDDRPSVSYLHVAAPVRTNPTDGVVSHTVAAIANVLATDGIAPELPELDAVSQTALNPSGGFQDEFYGAQGGAFRTNQTTPTLRISNVESGYEVLAALDIDGNGSYDPAADTLLASCLATAAQLDCPIDLQVATEAGHPLLLISIDNADNVSEGATGASIVVDQTAPSIGDVTFNAGPPAKSVGVAFDEAIARGRNAAGDWRAFLDSNGQRRILRDTSVTGSNATRTLALASNETATSASGVIYTFVGAPELRYRDRAGNYLADIVFVDGGGA